MLFIHVCSWCPWYMARIVWSRYGAIRRATRESAASIISAGVIPDLSKGSSTSVCHQSTSVSAIRRKLSPYTRSQRSITVRRNPSQICASTSGTIWSSFSRRRSSGWGSANPTASRMTINSSTGIPVFSETSCNVTSDSDARRS